MYFIPKDRFVNHTLQKALRMLTSTQNQQSLFMTRPPTESNIKIELEKNCSLFKDVRNSTYGYVRYGTFWPKNRYTDSRGINAVDWETPTGLRRSHPLSFSFWKLRRFIRKEAAMYIIAAAVVILLIVLAIRSVTLDGAVKGLEFYLKPVISKVTASTFDRALGQAFFSLSLGMRTMLTYGSYISKRDNIVTSASSVVFFDTLIAILAGLVMFPALFAMKMDPAGGPGLVFVVLPSIFAKMPGGMFFGAGIFLLLSVAALTSTISLLEVPVAYFVDEKKWSRKKATIWMA